MLDSTKYDGKATATHHGARVLDGERGHFGAFEDSVFRGIGNDRQCLGAIGRCFGSSGSLTSSSSSLGACRHGLIARNVRDLSNMCSSVATYSRPSLIGIFQLGFPR